MRRDIFAFWLAKSFMWGPRVFLRALLGGGGGEGFTRFLEVIAGRLEDSPFLHDAVSDALERELERALA